MKNISLIIFAFFALVFSSCTKDYVGDTYDFSNSLSAYVEFSPSTPRPIATKTVKQGTSFAVTVQLRTALSEDVTVGYQVTGTTATIQGTIVILRNTTKTTANITLPTGIVVAPAVSVSAQLKLVSAVKGTDVLRIGFKNPGTEVIPLIITP
jgi:hypothetical protein